MTVDQTAPTPAVMQVRELHLGSQWPGDFTIPGNGLSIIHTDREAKATTLALILAGRMTSPAGSVTLYDADGTELANTARARGRYIALAGVSEIDSLERLVTVRTVVREQLAWAGKWWSRAPKDISSTSFGTFSTIMGLDVDPEAFVGKIPPVDRLRLRICLALIARPTARMLIVDDIDQVRSMKDRAVVLRSLQELAEHRPVLTFSSNPDPEGLTSTFVDLTRGTSPDGQEH